MGFSTNLRKLILTVLIFAFLAATPSSAEMAPSSRALYKKGLWSYRKGNVNKAIKYFANAATIDPGFPHPYFAIGRIYQDIFEKKMTHYNEARAWYEALTDLLDRSDPAKVNGSLWSGYLYQGLLYLKGGQYESALSSLTRFIEKGPEHNDAARAHNGIGIANYYLDRYDEAIKCFRTALDIDPDYLKARFNLRSIFTRLSVYNQALALKRTGDVEAAFAKVERLKEFAPRYLPGRKLEATLHLEAGRPKTALGIFNEILGTDPNHPLAYSVRLEMAKIHAELGNEEEAHRLLVFNLEALPDSADPRLGIEGKQLLEEISR